MKEVSGTVGPDPSFHCITSLLLVTNTASYGPFGDGHGIPFRSPVQDNDSIVGFFAQATKHINAIGFYLESMKKEVLFLLAMVSVHFSIRLPFGPLLICLSSGFSFICFIHYKN